MPDVALAAAGPALATTIQPLVVDAPSEFERAALQSNPYQVVVLRAEPSNEVELTQAARALLGRDGNAYLGLAAAPGDMSWCRVLAAGLGDRIFVVGNPLGEAAIDLIRVVIAKWHTDKAHAEMEETTQITQRAYKLVDAEFRRQNARLLKQEQAMAEQSALLEATLNSMRQGLLVLTADLSVSVFNGCMAEFIGFSPEVLRVGAKAYDLIAAAVALGHYPGRSVEDVYEAWRVLLARRAVSTHRQTLASGRELAVNYAPMADGGWVITYDDITDRIRAEEALEQQYHRFDAALNNTPHGLCMFDTGKQLILCNAAYGQMYGLPKSLLMRGTPLQHILDFRASVGNEPADLSTYFDVVELARQKDGAASTRVSLRDGRTIQITHNPMAGGSYVAAHEDITESIRADAQIAHMAHHDALTGLPNRVLLRERATEALQQARRGAKLTMLCLDLDHFKAVNDTLGHPIGDLLLKAVAARLQGCVRKMDTVARIGGDEFVIMQNQIDSPQQADALARRLAEAVREPYDLDGHQVVISASIGVAVAPNDGDDADRLLKNADTALYRAKSEGRGLYRFFEAAMDARLQQRRLLELDLRRAFISGDFQLHYQPIVDAQSEEIIGVEALLRWKHHTRGMVSPAEFIPVAESIGLIVPLGEWVIRQACSDAAKWPKDVKVAVNLSPAQFVSQNLVAAVTAALAESNLSSNRLELEITESVLLTDNQATLATLHQLRDLGVRIAMDDFGTGYSSLSYLRSFPFDKIKIDRSFIAELGDREDCTAIVKAVAGLGANLGMTTTAEGVETAEQLRLVREQGCTEIQGYYFSPARPMIEITRMLQGEIAAVA